MYSFSYLEPVCCSMSSSNCFLLTCIQISQEAGQVVWYSHLSQNFPQFIVIYTVKGFGIVNKAEIDLFLELSCFFHDPAAVGNLISGSSALSKTSLNIRRNAGLEETQAGIKIAGRNISNLRYADDTTFMEERKEDLKSLLTKVKEESEKAGLKLSIQKTEIKASSPITSCQIDGETTETVSNFNFGGSKITADGDFSHEIK